jgi:hypothetical protein
VPVSTTCVHARWRLAILLAVRRHLYKYFTDRRWAEAFLDGQLLFRSLSYFRDYEDQDVRGDSGEGKSVFRPEGGLVGYNHTQQRSFVLPNHAFVSNAKAEQIFVFCLSGLFSPELWQTFNAAACVEVLNIAAFCNRIEAALPQSASFPGRPQHTRIGRWITYYQQADATSPRWALPDEIATSKLDAYRWQNEFRLVFSLTDALGFEKVSVQLVAEDAPSAPAVVQHERHLVEAHAFHDICRLVYC